MLRMLLMCLQTFVVEEQQLRILLHLHSYDYEKGMIGPV